MKRNFKVVLALVLMLALAPTTALAGAVPMGRYVERSLPCEMGDYRMFTQQNGMTYALDPINLTLEESSDLLSWTMRPIKYDKSLYPGNADPRGFSVAPDGSIYLLEWAFDETQKLFARLVHVTDEGQAIVPLTIDGQADIPTFTSLYAMPDGSLMLLDDAQGAMLFSADGALRTRYRMPDSSEMAVGQSELAFYSYGLGKVTTFDLKNSIVTRELSVPDAGVYCSIDYAPDGTLYLVSTQGIYRVNENGTLWEQIVDGALATLSNPSVHVTDILFDSSGDPVLAFQDASSSQYLLIAYKYDETVPSEPTTRLSVYTLYDNQTVKQAAAAFQAAHPEVMVNLIVALGEGSAITRDDAIRTLNTEILAGKGPDVIVLDDLPVDSYIGKGILADLKDVVGPMIEDGQLLKTVASTFAKDNALPVIPARFNVPTLWGDVRGIETMADLAAWAKANPDALPFFSMELDVLMEVFYPVCMPAWIDEGKRLDEGQLAAFLTMLSELRGSWTHEAATQVIGFDVAEMFVQMESWNPHATTYGIGSMVEFTNASCMFDGSTHFTPFSACGIDSTALCNSAIQEIENGSVTFMPGQAENVYMPRCLLGVNAMGGQVDLAKQFVLLALNSEVQRVDLNDGFPVNASALDYSLSREESTNGTFATGTAGNKPFSSIFPGADVRGRLRSMIDALKTPLLPDMTLYQMVLDEAAAFMNGTLGADQAAANIVAKANAYLSE